MSAERLLKLYERVADGVDAITRLRRFTLNLAVCGKLVPQEAKDEPASELLKKIQRNREHRRKFADLNPEELEPPLPYIPAGWIWTVVDQISNDDDNAITDGPFGAHLKTEHYISSPGFRVIRLQNIGQGTFRDEHRSFIDKVRFDSLPKHHVKAGDLIVAGLVDPAIRCCELPSDIGPALVKADCYRLSVHPMIVSRYALQYLNSPIAQEFASVHHHGMTLTRIGLGNFRQVPLPLPPLSEQHRIVAKVDELMALCDRLDAARTQREAARDRLAVASLARLNVPDSEKFHDDVRFALDALPVVTARADQIKLLRQTILNLAVRGKLAPQNLRDEPINVTLRKAIARRAALIRSKKIRQKKLDGYADLAADGELPASWTLERLGNLVDPEHTISYGVLVPGEDVPDGVPFVRAQDLALSSHPDRPNKTISPEIEKAYARTRLRGGEILVCVVGSIGKLGIAPQSWAGANIARAVARILPIPEILREYLLIVLRGEPVQSYFKETTRTLAQPTLNVGLIEQTPIPLAPLAEQHRIVAKVDELMSLCDRLEASLATGDDTRRRLLDALLAEALAPAETREKAA